jgi:ADP-ribosylation factor-like protein 6
MGLFDKLASIFSSSRRDANLIIVGLDNSGKTSIINYLKPKDAKLLTIVPTVGFNVEKFTVKSLNFTVFDMSGQGRYRNLWEHYYKDVDAIIFVIDSTDPMRLVVSKEELTNMLFHKDLKSRNIPILLFANKNDINGSYSTSDIKKELQVDKITDKPYKIFASNALTGEGVIEGD